MDIAALQRELRAFAAARDWQPFHPKTGSYPVAGSSTGGVGGPMTGAMRSLM